MAFSSTQIKFNFPHSLTRLHICAAIRRGSDCNLWKSRGRNVRIGIKLCSSETFSFPSDIKTAFKSTRNLSNWNEVFSFAWLEFCVLPESWKLFGFELWGFVITLQCILQIYGNFPKVKYWKLDIFPFTKPSGNRAMRFKLECHNERSVEQTTQSHKLRFINGTRECVCVIWNESSSWILLSNAIKSVLNFEEELTTTAYFQLCLLIKFRGNSILKVFQTLLFYVFVYFPLPPPAGVSSDSLSDLINRVWHSSAFKFLFKGKSICLWFGRADVIREAAIEAIKLRLNAKHCCRVERPQNAMTHSLEIPAVIHQFVDDYWKPTGEKKRCW